ncbi:SDR family oxidoreductase [Telmatospirillum sp. J64-1]|uniref:SDR family oxidoreductase n=1 Tax=Telmatospirillum sp. J64-1 TaxID=2502183 RepID=UPI001C8F6F87|nr:SDR family oxidoreductase [Telmatospirillum sp. J64-1]
MRLKPLTEQTIVITGASSGIGLATAREAGAAGARVVVAARNEAALDQLVAEIEAAGGSALAVKADVSHEAEVRHIAEQAVIRFGGFDTWFNNAGTTIFGKTEEVSLADHRRLFETNYWGVVHGSLTALPHLRQRGGALINMGSMLSDIPAPLHGPYNATKHAIKAFTETLRMELQHDGAPVSVTLVKPAAVDTPLQEHATNYLPVKPILPPPAYLPRLVAQSVLQAAQQPMRELLIGEVAQMFSLAGRLSLPATEQLLEASMFRLQQSDQPDLNRHPNLYNSTTGGQERGDHPLVIGDSLYTRFVSTPAVNSAGNLASRMANTPMAFAGYALARTMEGFIRRPH